jgi:16S rRNA (guanine1207-N2)-methyltransferase
MNPPVRTGKSNLYRLYNEAMGRLCDGGAFYLVIQKKQGMESTQKELQKIFGNCVDIARKAGYHVLRSVK